MNNYVPLLQGEIQRMKKYNIFNASFLVALLWIGVLHFTDLNDISSIFPLLLFMDATSMAIILIGVTMMFEKEEGSLKSLLVSPIQKKEYILAKTASNLTSNVLTFVLLYLYAMFFKELHLHVLWLFGAVVLISFFHSMVGFLLSYSSKTFTQLLMGMMKYFFLLMLPVLLEWLDLLTGPLLSNLLYLLPTKASMTLLLSSAGGMESWEVLFSVFYLLLLSLLLFTVVVRRFDEYAAKESGV